MAVAESSGFKEEILGSVDRLIFQFESLVFVDVHQGVARPDVGRAVSFPIVFEGDGREGGATSLLILSFEVKFGDLSDFGDDLPSALDLWIGDKFSIPAEEELIWLLRGVLGVEVGLPLG